MAERKEAPEMLELELNGCRVKLIFAAEPKEGLIERIQDTLSYAYEERIVGEERAEKAESLPALG